MATRMRSIFWMVFVLLGIPACAQAMAEREPNDVKEQALRALFNKAQNFRFADGPSFPYCDASGPVWMIFYSPNCAVGDTPAAGGEQPILSARGSSPRAPRSLHL